MATGVDMALQRYGKYDCSFSEYCACFLARILKCNVKRVVYYESGGI